MKDSEFTIETSVNPNEDYIAFLDGDGNGNYINKRILIRLLLSFNFENPIAAGADGSNFLWFDITNKTWRTHNAAPTAEDDGTSINATTLAAAATAAAAAIATHNSETQNVHGIADTADLVVASEIADFLENADIGVTVQAYDSQTAKLDETSTFKALRSNEDLNVQGDFVSNERMSITGRLLADTNQSQLSRVQADIVPQSALGVVYGQIFLAALTDSAFDVTQFIAAVYRTDSGASYTGNVVNVKGLKVARPVWNSPNLANTFRGLEMDDFTPLGFSQVHGLYLFGATQDHYIAGNLGLGTATPSEQLHVVGNIQVDGEIVGHVIGTDVQAHSDVLDEFASIASIVNDSVGINAGASSFYHYNFGTGATKRPALVNMAGDIYPTGAYTVLRLVPDIRPQNNLTGTSYANNNNAIIWESDVDGLSYDLSNFSSYFSKVVFSGTFEGSMTNFRGLHVALMSHGGTPANPVQVVGFRGIDIQRQNDPNVLIDRIYGVYLNLDEGDAAVNDWAIYSGGSAKSYHAGSFGIGVATPSEKLDVAGNISLDGTLITGSFTVATLPSAVEAGIIYVSDEAGGSVLAFSDGTDWRRCTDRAVVS